MSQGDLSEENEVIESLPEGEYLLKTVLTNTPVLLWAINPAGTITFLEGQGLDTLGLSGEKDLNKPYAQVFIDFPELIEYTARALEGHLVSMTLQRDHMVLDTRLSPIVNDEGEIAGVTGIAFDITDLKSAETALRAQKQLFENLVAIARATTERPTLEATLQNALDVAAELTGAELGSLFTLNEEEEVVHSILARGRTELVQKDQMVNRVMKSGLAGWVVRNLQSALVTDTIKDDRWLVRPSDKYEPRSALSVPILNQSSIVGVLTLTHPEPNRFTLDHLHLIQAAADQMALALTNAQMFEEQRKLADIQQTLYKVLRTIGSHLDPEAVSVAAVHEIERLTEWSHIGIALPNETGNELLVQAEAGEYKLGEEWSLDVDQGIVGRAFRTGESQYITDVHADPDYIVGHTDVRSELAIPLRRGDLVLGVLNIENFGPSAFSTTDIQLAESIADAVSLAFENARLFEESRNTADRLRELDRLKSSFLANMSHELRTPLNAILGYSELLHEDAQDFGIDDFATDLEKIQKAGKHLLAVINDILDFSKIEAGRMDLFLESFDVSALVDDVVTTMHPVVEKNENTLKVQYFEGLGSMTADPTKVRSILLNLLSNATKFSEKGVINLDAVRMHFDEIEWIQFTVTDVGIGMSTKQLNNLFQPFIQGDISTTRKYGGTGLGLAITRGFCEMMGGEIFVESELGIGSTFTVRLPVEVPESVKSLNISYQQ
jgi:PAS domain S-box-containing protein